MGRFINADSYTSTGQGILGHNMFAYCGNNPVSRFDPAGYAFTDIFATAYGDIGFLYSFSAGQAISLMVSNNAVYVDAYMTFRGDVDPEYLIQGIKHYWEGTYSYENHTIDVYINIHDGKSSRGHTIHVNTSTSYGRSYCTKFLYAWSWYKESTITLYADYYSNTGCDWTVAHEFGHCLGIGDYYIMSHLPEFDPSFPSIMNTVGAHATTSDILKMIYAFAYNVPQKWYCVGGL